MPSMIATALLAAALLGPGIGGVHQPPRSFPNAEPIRVVATLPIYASLVKEIGGDEVVVTSIANANEDAHFVRPKPSFALDLRRAQAFVTTGLDLELWVPPLLDKARNPDVMEGGKGYITAYTGIHLLEVPVSNDRSAGDVHVYGNPHLTTEPLTTLQIARNITTGLDRVAPDRAHVFDAGLSRFTDRVYRKLYGDRLVELLGGSTLEQLSLKGTLFDFLEANDYQGRPLIQDLGGWLKEAEVFRGGSMICYHKNWAYFEDRFQVKCVDYIEPKPGIPPTPGHVAEIIRKIQAQHIKVLLAASYFDRSKVEMVAERSGATLVRVPMEPGVLPGVDDYFTLVDTWVRTVAAAFAKS
jgi:zinc/manganese transport system substrate-binding protein